MKRIAILTAASFLAVVFLVVLTGARWTPRTVFTSPANLLGGTGSPGQVAFWTATETIGGDVGLFWDSTNKRLGIGTASPSQRLTVSGGDINVTGSSTQTISVESTATNQNSVLLLQGTSSSTGVQRVQFKEGDGTGSANNIAYSFDYDGGNNRLRLSSSNIDGSSGDGDIFRVADGTDDVQFLGNVGIGTATPASTLQVVGNYIQFPTISGGPPPAADCDSAAEAGRMVVRTDGTINLYVCTGATGWVGYFK